MKKLFLTNGKTTTEYTDIRTHISFYLTENNKRLRANANYQHQKKKTAINYGDLLETASFAVSMIYAPNIPAQLILGVTGVYTSTSILYTKDYYETAGGASCYIGNLYK